MAKNVYKNKEKEDEEIYVEPLESPQSNVPVDNVSETLVIKTSERVVYDNDGFSKVGDIEWNEDGDIIGGSGIAMFWNGLIGAADGVETFHINPTTGNVVLTGSITATTGAIGGWIVAATTLADNATTANA